MATPPLPLPDLAKLSQRVTAQPSDLGVTAAAATASMASFRAPRALAPPIDTVTDGTLASRSCALIASAVRPAYRSGHRSRQPLGEHRPVQPGLAGEARASASVSDVPGGPGGVLAERVPGQRPGAFTGGPGAGHDGLGGVDVEEVGPAHLGRVLADQVAEPGVDLRPERGRPDPVLVRADVPRIMSFSTWPMTLRQNRMRHVGADRPSAASPCPGRCVARISTMPIAGPDLDA